MPDSVLRILTYHRVFDGGAQGDVRPDGVSAIPAQFRRQMRHLANRFRVLSAEEVLFAVRSGRPLPPRAVLVTFDDAYQDFGDVAWPILRSCGLPATLFVPTAFPDRSDREFWWDRLHRIFNGTSRRALAVPTLGMLSLETRSARWTSLRVLEAHVKAIAHVDAMRVVEEVCAQLGEVFERTTRVLGWNDLRALAKDGVTLAPHTRTHPALTRLPVEEARTEIRGSREDLRREIGDVASIFAYPFGLHDDRIVQLMRDEGFDLALSCIDGHNHLSKTDPLRLRRTNITTRTTSIVFRARLHPLGAYVDRWRHRGAHASEGSFLPVP